MRAPRKHVPVKTKRTLKWQRVYRGGDVTNYAGRGARGAGGYDQQTVQQSSEDGLVLDTGCVSVQELDDS